MSNLRLHAGRWTWNALWPVWHVWMGRGTWPLVRGAGGGSQKGVVRDLDLMVWGVIYWARITVLGGWGEELGAGHWLVDGWCHYLCLLRQDGVDGHAGVAWALLELWRTELTTDKVLTCGSVWVLVLQLDVLLLLQLLEVLHLLHLLLLLLHDVGLWTQSGALDPLVSHHLRQAGGGMAIVKRGHQPMLSSLVQTSLTTRGPSHGIELAWLAYVAMHPGKPIALAIYGTLTTGARHGKMSETGRQRVKLHPGQLLLIGHYHVVHSQVGVRHALQMIKGYRWGLLEGWGHHRWWSHIRDIAMGGFQWVNRGQYSWAVEEAARLPILGIFLLHLHVFAILASHALGAGLAGLLMLALTLRLWLLHATQVAVGRAKRGWQGGAKGAPMHRRTSNQVVLIHQPHNVMVHSFLCNVSGQSVHVVRYFPICKVVQ